MCKCIYGFFMHLQNHDVKLKSYYLIVLNVCMITGRKDKIFVVQTYKLVYQRGNHRLINV